jgi:hypothetical protein
VSPLAPPTPEGGREGTPGSVPPPPAAARLSGRKVVPLGGGPGRGEPAGPVHTGRRARGHPRRRPAAPGGRPSAGTARPSPRPRAARVGPLPHATTGSARPVPPVAAGGRRQEPAPPARSRRGPRRRPSGGGRTVRGVRSRRDPPRAGASRRRGCPATGPEEAPQVCGSRCRAHALWAPRGVPFPHGAGGAAARQRPAVLPPGVRAHRSARTRMGGGTPSRRAPGRVTSPWDRSPSPCRAGRPPGSRRRSRRRGRPGARACRRTGRA